MRDNMGLYHAKRTYNGKWVEGSLVVTPQGDAYIISTVENKRDATILVNQCSLNVDPDTVGQYTGLIDKNGVKIFEGDIFKFNDEAWSSYYTPCGTEYDSISVVNYGVIGFDEDRGCFDFIKYKFNENSVEANLHINHDLEFCDFVSELEVVGNIHDNPELIRME